MAQARFLMDEDVYGATAIAMRKAGFNAISTPKPTVLVKVMNLN